MYIPQHLQNSAYFPPKTEELIFCKLTSDLNVDRQGEGGTLAVNIWDSITHGISVKVFCESIFVNFLSD